MLLCIYVICNHCVVFLVQTLITLFSHLTLVEAILTLSITRTMTYHLKQDKKRGIVGSIYFPVFTKALLSCSCTSSTSPSRHSTSCWQKPCSCCSATSIQLSATRCSEGCRWTTSLPGPGQLSGWGALLCVPEEECGIWERHPVSHLDLHWGHHQGLLLPWGGGGTDPSLRDLPRDWYQQAGPGLLSYLPPGPWQVQHIQLRVHQRWAGHVSASSCAQGGLPHPIFRAHIHRY